MKFLVDIGNTRVKWVTADGGAWEVRQFVLSPAEFDVQLDAAWLGLPAPEGVCVSCVAGQDIAETLANWCQRNWKLSPDIATAKSAQQGVVNNYDYPETLGSDRWLNLLAAHKQIAGNLCVIDCGSAVTIDALTADGRFLGGVIFPGLAMMQQSLHQHTAEINKQHGSTDALPSRNTADGVYTGTTLALQGAVLHIVNQYMKMFDHDMEVLLTGGDGELLKPVLGESVSMEPDLVLKGLNLIAGEKC